MSGWKKVSIAAAVVLSAGVVRAVSALQAQGQGQEPPMAGIHWAREHQPVHVRSSSPLLQYHGGPVMHGTFVQPIVWGTRWSDPAFVQDKLTGLENFYSGLGGSSYADTNTEYSDSTGHVSSTVTFGGILEDLTAASSGNKTAPILAEVCAVIGTNAVSNGFYPVYVDIPRGHAKFCAYHSAGTCPSGTTVQFAFFFNLDGDAGCDPRDTSGLHTEGMAALANVSGHETSEMLTDRHLNAWFDQQGQENSDKCAWTFGTPLLSLGGSLWKIQGNWSNAAFNAGTGFPNGAGEKGCIDGGNFK